MFRAASTVVARSTLLVGLACLLAGSALAASVGPREVIEQTAEEVIAILNEESLSSRERLEAIEKIVYARFDLETMSRLVVGRSWRQFNETQRVEYMREFKMYLSNYYGNRIDSYNQEKVEIVSTSDLQHGDVRVRTKMKGGEVDGTIVDYRLRQSDGQWLVIDITIEGITMVSNFRDQFREVIKRDGPEGLIKALKDKNSSYAG